MIEINNTTKVKLDKKTIQKVTEKFLQAYKINKQDVSLAFVSDEKMHELNKQYRKKDKTTDVLSFSGEGDFLGEIIINPKQIKRQAKENKNTFQAELIFILVHGLLHLVGYDDETEKARLKMIKLGEKFISMINDK